MLGTIAIAVITALFIRITTEPKEILSFYMRLIERLPEWLFKPLGGCAKCFAGQVALWTYPVICDEYILYVHLVTVMASVVVTYYLNLIINKYE
jgi:hypothetical protein